MAANLGTAVRWLRLTRERWLAPVCAAVLIIGIWSSYLLQARSLEDHALQESIAWAEDSVRSFEDYVVANLNLIDNELRFASTYYLEKGAEETTRLIEQRRLYDGYFDIAAVVDEKGFGRTSSDGGSTPVFIGDRAYFLAALQDAKGRMGTGPPVVSRTTGQLVIPFIRVVRRHDGTLVGAVTAGVQPELFSRFYDRSGLGEHGSLSVIAVESQVILARSPTTTAPPGQNISSSTLWKALEKAPQGIYWQQAFTDHVTRVYAYRRLANHPLVLSAGVALEDIAERSASLRRNLFLAASGATLIVLIVLSGWMAQQSMRQKLRQSHDRLELEVEHRTRELRVMFRAFEQSPNMVVITDVEGRIAFVNAAFTALSGYRPEEVMGQTPAVLSSGETSSTVYAAMWEAIKAGREWSGELKDRRKDGSAFWVFSMISPVFDEAGVITHFVALEQDITERKLAEMEMRDARRQAETASRAKSELLANMSHELRTPLNAIIGFSDVLRQELFGSLGNPKNGEYVEDIHTSGQHLLGLINDILDVSAIEAGKLTLDEETVDLGEVLKGCIRLIAPRASSGGVAVVNDASILPAVRADKRRLMQIVLNLLSNGVKFTPSGGHVILKCEIAADGGVAITIADSGIGMDEDGIAKAMQPFGQVDSQLQRKYEGTGLGLPLTKSLIELHEGRLEIASTPGIGTIVTVFLPAQRILEPVG